MTGPCYSSDVSAALERVVLAWWALVGVVTIAAAAVFFADRGRPT